MSDNLTPTPADVAPKALKSTDTPTHEGNPSPDVTPSAQPEPAQDIDWKAEARKWEQRAKENKAAAETASKTEAERLADLEKRAVEAEAKAARRDVALEFRLSKDDAGLLDAMTDEKAMRALAERLAGEADKRQNYVPGEGANPTPQTDSRRQFADFLTGRNNS